MRDRFALDGGPSIFLTEAPHRGHVEQYGNRAEQQKTATATYCWSAARYGDTTRESPTMRKPLSPLVRPMPPRSGVPPARRTDAVTATADARAATAERRTPTPGPAPRSANCAQPRNRAADLAATQPGRERGCSDPAESPGDPARKPPPSARRCGRRKWRRSPPSATRSASSRRSTTRRPPVLRGRRHCDSTTGGRRLPDDDRHVDLAGHRVSGAVALHRGHHGPLEPRARRDADGSDHWLAVDAHPRRSRDHRRTGTKGGEHSPMSASAHTRTGWRYPPAAIVTRGPTGWMCLPDTGSPGIHRFLGAVRRGGDTRAQQYAEPVNVLLSLSGARRIASDNASCASSICPSCCVNIASSSRTATARLNWLSPSITIGQGMPASRDRRHGACAILQKVWAA